MKMKNKKLFKKKTITFVPLMRKLFSNRFLRFRASASGRQSNFSFLRRGVFERQFLWRFDNDVWMWEWDASITRLPWHRTIWSPPPLARDNTLLLSTYNPLNSLWRFWVVKPRSYEAFHGDWRYWLFNRLIIFSAISSCIFTFTVISVLFYFILFVFPVTTEFLQCSIQLSIWVLCQSISLVSIIVGLVPVFFSFYATGSALDAQALAPRWKPKWTFYRPLARPGLRRVIRAVNRRHRHRLRFASFFTWRGKLSKHWFSTRDLVHNFHGLEASFNHNFFYWEKTPNYHAKGCWHYNVTQDFWFDMHYNYPTFIGNFGQFFRDISLDVHPFLLLRRVMTDVAVKLIWYLCMPWVHSGRFLQHYAKRRRVYLYSLFCAFIGRTVFYSFILFQLIRRTNAGFFSYHSWHTTFFRAYKRWSSSFLLFQRWGPFSDFLVPTFDFLSHQVAGFFKPAMDRFVRRYVIGARSFFLQRHTVSSSRFDFWVLSQIKQNFPFIYAVEVPSSKQFYSNLFFRGILQRSFRNASLAHDSFFFFYYATLRHFFYNKSQYLFDCLEETRSKRKIKQCFVTRRFSRFFFVLNFCLLLQLSQFRFSRQEVRLLSPLPLGKNKCNKPGV